MRIRVLPTTDAERARNLLKSYLAQRILFYTSHDKRQLEQINSDTARLQEDLWLIVQGPAIAQPTPVAALTLSGMNDVLNSQSYTQASWWNRIPIGAWVLMIALGMFCNFLFGYNAHLVGRRLLFIGLPFIVAVAFFLLAELDSPRSGIIKVHPENLESLSVSLCTP